MLKKRIVYLFIGIALLCMGCISNSHSEIKELKEQVAQLQKSVDDLKKSNGESASRNDSPDATVGTPDSNNPSSTKEQLAVKAIQYCLSKYCLLYNR